MQVSSFKVTVKILSCYNLGMSLYSVPSLLFINFVLCTINLLERYVASEEILRGRRREGMEGEKNKNFSVWPKPHRSYNIIRLCHY